MNDSLFHAPFGGLSSRNQRRGVTVCVLSAQHGGLPETMGDFPRLWLTHAHFSLHFRPFHQINVPLSPSTLLQATLRNEPRVRKRRFFNQNCRGTLFATYYIYVIPASFGASPSSSFSEWMSVINFEDCSRSTRWNCLALLFHLSLNFPLSFLLVSTDFLPHAIFAGIRAEMWLRGGIGSRDFRSCPAKSSFRTKNRISHSFAVNNSSVSDSWKIRAQSDSFESKFLTRGEANQGLLRALWPFLFAPAAFNIRHDRSSLNWNGSRWTKSSCK